MTINNINTNGQILNISSDAQSKATSKLSSGYKVSRDDTAATLSIKSNKVDSASENTAASASEIKNIDEVDAMIARARKNILAQPEQSVLAQANQSASDVNSLV